MKVLLKCRIEQIDRCVLFQVLHQDDRLMSDSRLSFMETSCLPVSQEYCPRLKTDGISLRGIERENDFLPSLCSCGSEAEAKKLVSDVIESLLFFLKEDERIRENVFNVGHEERVADCISRSDWASNGFKESCDDCPVNREDSPCLASLILCSKDDCGDHFWKAAKLECSLKLLSWARGMTKKKKLRIRVQNELGVWSFGLEECVKN